MGHKAILKDGAEFDVVTGWRKVLCYTQRAGVCKKIKKQMSRRNRREAKNMLRPNGDGINA